MWPFFWSSTCCFTTYDRMTHQDISLADIWYCYVIWVVMYMHIYIHMCVCFVCCWYAKCAMDIYGMYIFIRLIHFTMYLWLYYSNTIQYTVYRCRHDIFYEPERKKHKINNRHQLAILASSSFNYAVCRTYQSAPRDLCRRLSRKHFATTSIRHDPSLHCGNLASKISSNGAEKNIPQKISGKNPQSLCLSTILLDFKGCCARTWRMD